MAAPKRAAPSNAALAKQLAEQEARAATARARVDLLRAKIEMKGKQVNYDWDNGGKIKVVDRKR